MFKTLMILLIACSAFAENPASLFISDATHVYSSPLRIDKESAIKTGTLLTAFALFYKYDQEISDAFQRNMNHTFYRPIRDYGQSVEGIGHMGKMNKFWYGGLLFGYTTNKQKLTKVTSQIIECHLISGALRDLTTHVVGRNRPYGNDGPYSFSPGDGTSFLSGHSLNVWELATIASYHGDQKSISVLAYGTAASVSLQRITSLQHWPSDVLLGSVTGYVIAKTILRLHENRSLKITPAFTNSGGGISLTRSF